MDSTQDPPEYKQEHKRNLVGDKIDHGYEELQFTKESSYGLDQAGSG